MPPNEKTMLAKARQLNREVGPILLTIEGDPEVRKLQYLGLLPQGAMASAREAMIGDAYYAADAGETTGDFHARLKQVARERGTLMILLGHKSNIEPLRAAPPYMPAGAKLK